MAWVVVAAVVWLAVGCVVATFAIPWRDISVHARFAPMTITEGVGPRSSPWVARVFWLVCAVLWPFAWRWARLGVFAGSDAPPMVQLPPENA